MEKLKDSILKYYVENSKGQNFIPEARLIELLTAGTISQACKIIISASKRKDIAEKLFGKAKTVFIIFVLINNVELNEKFVKDNHFQASSFDRKLPFSIQYLESIVLNRLRAESFYNQQWTFRAAYFSDSMLPPGAHNPAYQKNKYLIEGGLEQFGISESMMYTTDLAELKL